MRFRLVVLSCAVVIFVAAVAEARLATERPKGLDCAGLRELFKDDLLACSDSGRARSSSARLLSKPVVAGVKVNKDVPKSAVQNLFQLYRYNTGIRLKVATQDWVQAFPEQTLPNYSEVASAVGCNQDVCIYVKGEGRVVDEWWTSAWQYYADGRVCPDVYWTVEHDPGTAAPYTKDAYFNNGENCARAPDPDTRVFWSGYTDTVPDVFESTTIICNRWRDLPADPLSGYPCVSVHS
jgi:hypothetical protein